VLRAGRCLPGISRPRGIGKTGGMMVVRAKPSEGAR